MTGDNRSRIRVLIAESDRVLGDLHREALESNGWSVELVHDGRSVLSRIRAAPLDVLLVDGLPDMDAFTIVEQVRADPSSEALVIVVLLDSVSNLDVQRAKTLDVQGWLSKTRITREELSETVRRLVEASAHEDRAG